MTDPIIHKMAGDIGEIVGTLKAIQAQSERDRKEASTARQRMYERVEKFEEVVEERVTVLERTVEAKVDKVEESVRIAAEVAAQARDTANTTAKVVSEDVKPQTDKIKNLGIKGGGFLAGAALIGGLGAGPVWAAVAGAIEKLTR